MPDSNKKKPIISSWDKAIEEMHQAYGRVAPSNPDIKAIADALGKKGIPAYQEGQLPNAYTRLTQTPIYVSNTPDEMRNYLSVTGEYDRPGNAYPAGAIHINKIPDASWKEFHNTLAHETIHAALQNYGQQNALHDIVNRGGFTNFWGYPLYEPMAEAMINARRAGDPMMELPAYLGATDKNFNDLNVSEDKQKQFMDKFRQQLYPATSHILDRIINAYHASQAMGQ